MTALNLRRIGGSDVAAILGVSDYSTAYDVWLRIVEGYSPPATTAMRAGKRFERAIGEWWAEERGHQIAWIEESIEHPSRPWQRLTPDLCVDDEPATIGDVKRARAALDRHGTPGTDEIAPYELVQLQTYLEGLTSIGEPAELGLLIVHDLQSDELIEWQTRRDPDFGALIVESCERFWRDHVVTRRPPAISGSDAARFWLERRRPRDTLPARPASLEEQRWCEEWRGVAAGIKQLQDREAVLKNQIRQACGEHRGLVGPFGRISYAAVAETMGPDWEAIARTAVPPETLERLSRELSTSKRGAHRRLAPYWTKETTR